MSRVAVTRIALVLAALATVEGLCRIGTIDRFTMIPPSEMVVALAHLLTDVKINADIVFTLRNIAVAIVLSVVGGFAVGVLLHAVPRLRAVLDPLFSAYYSVPTFVFYPLLIVVFGVGPTSLIVMGAMFGIVAMIVNTLIGLDRIPRVLGKVARVMRLDPWRSVLLVRLPAATPHLVTGVKLAVAYSVIGVVAGEFILATAGIGRRISFAYNDFDNRTMYGMLLFILTMVVIVNSLLHEWERRLHRRWGK